ncbi:MULTISPECIES: N-acetylglucosamine-6-phosphate deacetylase [unclassified Pseudodesulfovibrio]|uniref:N-acetylglucosamine-6-phosphate deacetylase n=1 Tax=unclassified Pseudodesulfovibrio TaxID=2661612 RepID=UPI000FEBEA37|nr:MULTISPECIES: N-acetylglucosamine-6-phosphate deacetylase [unclassified Pseudodesulfovibrio]MCJ2163231.1 N-acetylglucosamine-6-phosphate deacetylase [Pseudodesulfovibrio sp. S3-i]RWU07214.1 N-acetylglucosamine-6-phosphate deacetylase [Pseudodesulfovibrio sp. S3]
MRQFFVNGRIFTGDMFADGYGVEVRDGMITALHPEELPPGDARVVDLGGNLLAPGFIDIQVNGGGGVLFNDTPDMKTIETIIEAHRRFGTTSLLPTFISDRWDGMVRAAEAVRRGIAQRMPGLRGVHFEGPYINVDRKGIHLEENIRSVDEAALDMLSSGDMGVVMTTVAPEKVSPEYIGSLARAGVLVCAGHTAATYEQARAGLEAGIVGFTHLFNAMSPLTSREPGVVGAALEDKDSWVGVIADGHHIHFATLRVALAAKTQGKMLLITDAMPTVGAEDKFFVLQGQPITADGGRCCSAQGTLAGSDLDMAGAVRNAVEHLRLPLEEALRMASLYPARFLRLDDRLGRIALGFEADFVLLDHGLNVKETWIGGKAASA